MMPKYPSIVVRRKTPETNDQLMRRIESAMKFEGVHFAIRIEFMAEVMGQVTEYNAYKEMQKWVTIL